MTIRSRSHLIQFILLISFKKRGRVLRWKEAESKTQQIAAYNVERKMRAAYYLLNPQNRGSFNRAAFEWEENTDFVVIDPQQDGDQVTRQKMDILTRKLLSETNIRGNTPLDTITRHFRQNMDSFVDTDRIGNRAIGFNLITDGEPNNKNAFERELRYHQDTGMSLMTWSRSTRRCWWRREI